MNKRIYSFAMVVLMLLFSGNAMAKDVYLSSTGSDENDGKTAETAWATLEKAAARGTFNAGDVLHVSGTIKVNALTVNAHLASGATIVGEDPTKDGFDVQGNCGVLCFNNSRLIIKNLFFRNANTGLVTGQDWSGGSVITGRPLALEIDNCIFENNVTDCANKNKPSGAIYVGGTTANNYEIYLKVTNSKFIGNKANVNGGAICVADNVPVTIENCVFKDNVSEDNGGALYIKNVKSLTVKQCAFIGNKALGTSSTSKCGGAVDIALNDANNALALEAYTFQGCTFYDNYALANGGAIAVSYENVPNTEGNVSLNIVNCTIVGNTTGGSLDNAAGINVYNKAKFTVNIVNTILERNLAKSNSTLYSDVNFGTTPVKVFSSVIGLFRNYETNKDNYSVDGVSEKFLNKTSKISDFGYGTVGALTDKNYLPLSAGAALTIGNAAKASEYGVTTDQFGNAIGTKIGAVQVASEGGDGDWNISGLAEDGKTVTVARSLYPNDWNTICLPFVMTKEEQNEQFGEDAVVFYLNGAVKGDVLQFVKNSNDMKASCPYLVKVGTGKTTFKITKEITANTPSSRTNDTGVFQGVFFPTELLASDLCLGDNGTLFTPAEGQRKIYGLRAYFQVVEGQSLSAKLAILDGGTTGISNVTDEVFQKKNAIYTLSGVYVGQDVKCLEKGIYIVKGKKFVIK